jgi:hypothetical protein
MSITVAVWSKGALAYWNRGFEYHSRHARMVAMPRRLLKWFRPSARLCAHECLKTAGRIFMKFDNRALHKKTVKPFEIGLKLDKHNRHFAWRTTCISLRICCVHMPTHNQTSNTIYSVQHNLYSIFILTRLVDGKSLTSINKFDMIHPAVHV